jgi:hypothetical protein
MFPSEQITAEHIDELYRISPSDTRGQREKLLKSAKDRKLTMLEMSSSYGATCLVLAQSFNTEAV